MCVCVCVCVYKQDSAFNYSQEVICQKTQPINPWNVCPIPNLLLICNSIYLIETVTHVIQHFDITLTCRGFCSLVYLIAENKSNRNSVFLLNMKINIYFNFFVKLFFSLPLSEYDLNLFLEYSKFRFFDNLL